VLYKSSLCTYWSIFHKTEKKVKISRLQDHVSAVKWKDTCDACFLTSAQEDELVEASSLKWAHHKIKPTAVLDCSKCKTGVDRSDQMLSYYSFERKTIKWWKKLFFHVFDVAAHILHAETMEKKILLGIFYRRVIKGLLVIAGTEIQVQGQTSSLAGRHWER